MRRSRSKKLTRDLALTAGAAAAGISSCDIHEPTVCDPPPPPLCDALELDPMLRLSADRTTVPVDETILFSGSIGSQQASIGSFWISAPAGQVTEESLTPPDSISFRWGPRGRTGEVNPGAHNLEIWLHLSATDLNSTCTERDTVRVQIDSEGNASVLKLPEASGLGTYFRAELAATRTKDGFRLLASTSLPKEREETVTWQWRCSAGTLEPVGPTAWYVPDHEAGLAVIQVEAHLREGGIAVAVWHWWR